RTHRIIANPVAIELTKLKLQHPPAHELPRPEQSVPVVLALIGRTASRFALWRAIDQVGEFLVLRRDEALLLLSNESIRQVRTLELDESAPIGARDGFRAA